MSKKYYWFKLKADFFKRHDIRIVETMPNGEKYVLFYLKLMAESVSHNGELRFNNLIPYDENMLSTITNTNVDIVRSAMKVLQKLELLEILDDATIYMKEMGKLLGSETKWAEKQRVYREKEKQRKIGQCPSNVRQEIELEKEIDIEIEKEQDKIGAFFDSIWKLYPEKKGKASISDKTKNKLFNIGFEVLSTCIDRYKNYIKETGYNYKNGSTFFNSGYVDYLDENYEENTEGKNYDENGNELPF